MKSLSALILIALVPVALNAASRYEYDCENDADGAEGLCIAIPDDAKGSVAAEIPLVREKGRPPRDKSKMNAKTTGQAPAKTVFGASDVVASEVLQLQTATPNTATSQIGVNLGTQEKIRQVETFLQPLKGPQGFGDQGPAKAGQ